MSNAEGQIPNSTKPVIAEVLSIVGGVIVFAGGYLLYVAVSATSSPDTPFIVLLTVALVPLSVIVGGLLIFGFSVAISILADIRHELWRR